MRRIRQSSRFKKPQNSKNMATSPEDAFIEKIDDFMEWIDRKR